MHILTKFFVIVASVLSVLLAGLSIAYTHNADALVQAVKAEKAASKAAETEMAVAQGALSEERERAATERQALMAQVTQLQDEINDLEATRTRLAVENARLVEKEDIFSAQTARFTAVMDNFQQLASARSDEIRELRMKELDYARREIELGDRINDLSSQLEVASETNRALQERVVELAERLEIASTGGFDSGSSVAGVRRAPGSFNGRVSGVTTDAAGRTLVAINAGSNDMLSERMLLTVLNNGSFVATIRLESVDLNSAVGVVETPSRNGMLPSRDDRVIAAVIN